jgi:hypothetical protein
MSHGNGLQLLLPDLATAEHIHARGVDGARVDGVDRDTMTRLKVCMIRSTRCRTASARLTSPTQVKARRPGVRICAVMLSMSRHPTLCSSSGNVAGSRPVPVITISAPIPASATAVARPIPRSRPAPVTSATLPSAPPKATPSLLDSLPSFLSLSRRESAG